MSLLKRIGSLAEAIKFFEETMAANPERDSLVAFNAILAGKARKYPVIYLNHLAVPDDAGNPPSYWNPPVVEMPQSPEGILAREIMGMLEPLELLNPVSRFFNLGKGTGTYVEPFGIPLNAELGNTPSFNRKMEEVLADAAPDPESCPAMLEMKARIDLIKSCVPATFKIAFPNVQGPYNIAHAIAGEDALVGPYLDPDIFRAFMERVTEFIIGARKALLQWIGPDYLCPIDKLPHISECSVNLVAPDVYLEHILPHDKRIAAVHGQVRIHTCSGPHVFRATFDNLPLTETEAGYIPCAVAGYTQVADAFAAVKGKPITLNIGQEVPRDPQAAYEMICKDLNLYAEHSRITYGYTGMEWRREDRPMIRDIHRRLDDYWADKFRM